MDTLSAVGLTIPQTWTELLQFCGDARASGKIAFGLGLQNGWTTQLLMWALLASDIKDVDAWNSSLADGTFKFEGSAWDKALQQQQDMIDAGCFNDSPAGTDIDTAVLPGVVNGDFLGVVTVNAHGGTMENLAGEPLNLSLAPIPTSDDADASRLYTLYTAGFGVNANSKHIDLAKKLVEAFTTAEGVNLYADEAGAIPSVPNDAFTAKPFLKESAAIIGENRVASGDWTPGADTLTALTNGVQGVVIGTSTVDDMLAAMQQGYDAYIKEIGVK